MNIEEYKLNKDVPIPLYYQLKQAILSKIISGEIRVDECLPTEMDFVNVLGISRSTVRQAFDDLANEGYLYRVKGKGSFVSKPKVDEGFFQKLDSFNHEMIQKGFLPSTKVLDFKLIPGVEGISERLNAHKSEKLLYLCRLRYANNEPVVYLETYISYDKHKDLLNEDFSEKSLYAVLEEKYNERIERAIRKIEAVNANSKEARLFNIGTGAAICLVKTTAFISDNTPVEYSVARYRGDRNQFTVELARK